LAEMIRLEQSQIDWASLTKPAGPNFGSSGL
jgi:hypothetical protein